MLSMPIFQLRPRVYVFGAGQKRNCPAKSYSLEKNTLAIDKFGHDNLCVCGLLDIVMHSSNDTLQCCQQRLTSANFQ